MESNLVDEFVAKTGATAIEAHNQLIAKGWNLNLAIKDYLNNTSGHHTSKPILTKSDAIDESYKKLARGISRATDNACVVSKARAELGLGLRVEECAEEDQYLSEAPVFSFTLPDFSIHSDGFRDFLERDLIELSCLSCLEQAGRLNWWVDTRLCPRLWPLSTTGDGNCLLHAASLGMWGFHDRLLVLRQALHDFLTRSPRRQALYRRWRWQLTWLNAEAGLVYTEEEWAKEWDAIISMASSTPRNSGRRRSMIVDKSNVPENATYESLEEIHVLALAHVLKRTIIVIADTMLKDVNGENLAPILFGGTYLPLEIAPEKCHKNPLVLSYEAAHFSALVAMDMELHSDKASTTPALIPLTDSDYKLLPVQFVVDPGKDFEWGRDELAPGARERFKPSERALHSLLREYLEVVLLPLSVSPSSEEYDDMDTPGDEEDIEKRFCETELPYDGEDQTDSAAMFPNNKSRAARQLQTVAKSFGSIGKSMSKKFKKNLGTITKMTRGADKRERGGGSTEEGKVPEYMVCARLGGDARPDYQQQMVHNYLNTARTRYERDLASKGRSGAAQLELERLQVQAKMEGPKNCITPDCPMYASVLTSYLCSACYEKQRQQEINSRINSPLLPRHGASQSYDLGKSKFYVEPLTSSVDSGVTLRAKPPEEPPPLNINRATFYSDRFYPRDWSSSSASAGRSTLAGFAPKEITLKRNTLQDVGNAIDGLGTGRYTPTQRGNAVNTDPVSSLWEKDNAPVRKIHSYNLSRDSAQPAKQESTVFCVKGSGVVPQASSHSRMSTQNSTTSSVLCPQNSQDLTEVENVQPSRASSSEGRFTRVISIGSAQQENQTVTRIIPISVEGRSRPQEKTCLNVNCTFYGSPNLENYCSKCYKGRKGLTSQTAVNRPLH